MIAQLWVLRKCLMNMVPRFLRLCSTVVENQCKFNMNCSLDQSLFSTDMIVKWHINSICIFTVNSYTTIIEILRKKLIRVNLSDRTRCIIVWWTWRKWQDVTVWFLQIKKTHQLKCLVMDLWRKVDRVRAKWF